MALADKSAQRKRSPVRALGGDEGTERRREADDLFDQVDVPAAVVCALCGDAECPGCANEPSRSGVVAVVAWERPGSTFFARLWSTARAATLDAERFFESMPDGPVAPALRFAVTCEVMAATAMVLFWAAVAAIFAPLWLEHIALEDGGMLIRLLFPAIPALAALLVAAHAAHGYALYRGARSTGHRPSASRALRFGLYASGWDLVIGPIGAIVLAIKEGAKASLKITTLALGLPARSARAFLRGAYRIEGKKAEAALRSAYVVALVATAVGAIAIVSGGVLIALS